MIQFETFKFLRGAPGADDGADAMEEVEDSGVSTAVVLHEDKKYYPDADEVYPEAETMVQVYRPLQTEADFSKQYSKYKSNRIFIWNLTLFRPPQDEDTQPLEKPIIAPIRTKNFDHVEKKIPTNPYSTVFMHELCGIVR